MFIQLAAKNVGRKEVVSILKSITYSNVNSDPVALVKLLRVTLRCNSYSPSQAIAHIDIQLVDDVTEIRLANQRPKFRPGNALLHSLGAWPIAPFKRVTLVDPDTLYLDGGGFIMELLGGGVRGDFLGFLTTSQQQAAAKEFDVKPLQLELAKDKLLLHGNAVGTLEYPKSSVAGINNLKINFYQNEPPAITLELCSYIISCITFGTATKITAGQRTFCMKIRDAENPVEGRQRVVIDVCKPLVSLPGDKAVVKNVGRGETITILDKVVCVLEGKKDTALTTGFIEITLDTSSADDSLIVSPPALARDGGIYISSDYIGKLVATTHRIRVDFGWASKATSKNLSFLLTSIQFKSREAMKVQEDTNTILYQCTDMASEASCFSVTINIKQ